MLERDRDFRRQNATRDKARRVAAGRQDGPRRSALVAMARLRDLDREVNDDA